MTEKGIDLIGSMRPDTSWQAKAAATIEDETVSTIPVLNDIQAFVNFG